MISLGFTRFQGGSSGIRPGEVVEARKNETKKSTAERLVIIDILIIRENMPGLSVSIVAFRVAVNEKLNIAHNAKENVVKLIKRAFISRAAFFSWAI